MKVEARAREALKKRGLEGAELNLLTEIVVELHNGGDDKKKKQQGSKPLRLNEQIRKQRVVRAASI